jgi:hypothetical protein
VACSSWIHCSLPTPDPDSTEDMLSCAVP